MPSFPSTTPDITPTSADLVLLADVDNSNTASDATVGDVVLAGLGANTSDDLPQGATNLYLTPAEQTKLAGITAGAQPNAVISVNGFVGVVNLTQDDVGNGGTFVQTENNYSAAAVADVAASVTHIATVTGNPHNVTNAEVGLGNVTDDAQLKRAAADFDTFPQKVSLHPSDIVLIEDSVDSFNKKKVEISDLSTEVVDGLATSDSLEVVGSTLQLKNDQTPPAEDTYFGFQDNTKGWFKKYTRIDYPATTDINIPTGYSLALHGGLNGGGIVDGPGLLYIL